MMLISVAASVAVSAGIAIAGHRAKALTGRGAVVSTLVGTSIIGSFGGHGALLLGYFFASGSCLSRLPVARRLSGGTVARNERQVLANGGVAAVAGVGALLIGRERAVAILAGSLAAATSDTWATEFGLQFGRVPRYVLSGRPVAPGLSGGITPAGTLASVGGAATAALLAGALYRDGRIVAVALAAGMSGSILDSVLGEAVQVKRRAPVSRRLTEDARENGAPTRYASGWRWVDNDVVNLACTLTGGVVALVLWRVAWEG